MSCYLVIKTSSFGDILQTLPEVLKLKTKEPSCTITWVVEKKCASLLEPIAQIDHLLVVDFKAWRRQPFYYFKQIRLFFKKLRQVHYDLALDFQANTKSALLLALCKADQKRCFAKNQVSECLHKLLKITRIGVDQDHYSTFYGDLIADIVGDIEGQVPTLKQERLVELPKAQRVIMLGLSSMWPSKELSADQIGALIKTLNDRYCPYFLIPALDHEQASYARYLVGYEGRIVSEKHLLDYVPYLRKTDLFVGVDSAFLHLARVFKVPSKGYFGPSSAQFYGQQGDRQGLCPYGQTFIKRCSLLRKCPGPCLKTIDLTDEI
jgi:heptosyltransferase-1